MLEEVASCVQQQASTRSVQFALKSMLLNACSLSVCAWQNVNICAFMPPACGASIDAHVASKSACKGGSTRSDAGLGTTRAFLVSCSRGAGGDRKPGYKIIGRCVSRRASCLRSVGTSVDSVQWNRRS